MIVISPTRELSMQTYGVLVELVQFHHFTHGLIMGGSNRLAEAQKLAKGINILIATPGRLLDHLQVKKNVEFFRFTKAYIPREMLNFRIPQSL